ITGVSFKDQSLKDALDTLADMSNIGMYTDNLALQDAGISMDQLLTIKLPQGISVKSALNILLGQARLTYVVEHQMLKITTHENANNKLKRVIYPVADLVIPVDNHTLAPSANLNYILDQHVQNGGPLSYAGGIQPYVPTLGLHEGAVASNPGSGVQTVG